MPTWKTCGNVLDKAMMSMPPNNQIQSLTKQKQEKLTKKKVIKSHSRDSIHLTAFSVLTLSFSWLSKNRTLAHPNIHFPLCFLKLKIIITKKDLREFAVDCLTRFEVTCSKWRSRRLSAAHRMSACWSSRLGFLLNRVKYPQLQVQRDADNLLWEFHRTI